MTGPKKVGEGPLLLHETWRSLVVSIHTRHLRSLSAFTIRRHTPPCFLGNDKLMMLPFAVITVCPKPTFRNFGTLTVSKT
jgi:hypothetical protein